MKVITLFALFISTSAFAGPGAKPVNPWMPAAPAPAPAKPAPAYSPPPAQATYTYNAPARVWTCVGKTCFWK